MRLYVANRTRTSGAALVQMPGVPAGHCAGRAPYPNPTFCQPNCAAPVALRPKMCQPDVNVVTVGAATPHMNANQYIWPSFSTTFGDSVVILVVAPVQSYSPPSTKK